jgi:hypothetical protein
MSKSLRNGLSALFLIISFVLNAFPTDKRLDFDGDGKADISLYLRSNGFFWTIKPSGGATIYRQQFGITEDIAAPGDYNGDGRTEYGVFRPSTGIWYNSTTAFPNVPSSFESVKWGVSGDIPVQGDYDGDTITDRAVFRPSEGKWYVRKSSGGFIFFNWGTSGDRPVPQDFDGDGKTDFAVARNSGGLLVWYVYRSSDNTFQNYQFGLSSDLVGVSRFNSAEFGTIKFPTVFRPSNYQVWYRNPDGTLVTNNFWGAPNRGLADYDGDGQDDYGDWGYSAVFQVLPWYHSNHPYYTYIGTGAETNLASIYFY